VAPAQPGVPATGAPAPAARQAPAQPGTPATGIPATGAPPQGVAPPPPPGATAPGQPAAGQPPQRETRRGFSPGVAAAIGAGAGLVGGIMATQGAQRLDDIRARRQEEREGDVTIIREPGRTIIRGDDGTAIIRRDEDQRYRDLGWQGRSERRGQENRTIFERPDGSRVITVTDEQGRLLRRIRTEPDGREVIIIDNTVRGGGPGRFADEVVVLPPPPLPIPRERYIVNADQADESLIYETIMAPPIAAIPRRYTLDEVRYSPDLRARMRSVDIDTINFETGSWQVTADQAQRLAVIADSVRRVLQGSPNEVFLVEGHTDAVGSDIDNLSLSDRRAQSVAEILTRDFQIPPENLTTQGYGEQYLKVQTQAASRENRRVTLRRITPLLTGQSR
jgi:outer membrane protein OmpA-like peptidoglycan-associated protein